jgi:hypothetical protein
LRIIQCAAEKYYRRFDSANRTNWEHTLVLGFLVDDAYMNVNYERKSLNKSTGNYYVSPVKKLPHSERIIRIMSHKDWNRLKNIPQQKWENAYGLCTVIYYSHLLNFMHFNGKGGDNTCTFTMSELTNN